VIPEKQYGAGNVIVWDCGVYSPDEGGQYSFTDRAEAERRVRAELAQGKLSFLLRGEKLKGSFTLVKTRTGNQWLLIKHRDRFAQANDVLAQPASVLSGLNLDQMTPASTPPRLDAGQLSPLGPPEAMPRELAPMLAETAETLDPDPHWRYEPKLDGYRTIAYVRGADVQLKSRRGLDLTALFPELTEELGGQAIEQMILDGEIVALDAAGRPSFNALQNRAQLKGAAEIAAARRDSPVVLVCFDLLHFAGLNLRAAPYLSRRRYLAQCLLPSAHVQLVHSSDNGPELYNVALSHGFEGVVAKRADSTYQPGKRSRAWLKIKATQSAEFVVGGFTRGKGARDPLGALLLGYYDGKALRYAGHVGSGLDDEVIARLLERTARLTRKESPFAAEVPLHRPTTWLAPQLVAEVTFAEWTPDGSLRAPVFVRLRDDIEPAQVRKPDPNAKPAVPEPPAGRGGSRRSKAAARGASGDGDPPDAVGRILEQLDNRANRLDLEVGGARIRLTNLDRVYWPAAGKKSPAVTKRDLLRYLARVGRFMLPHLQDRPLTMIRMPEGIGGERFFQKHWEQPLPEFVETVTVFSETKDDKHRYLLANNLPTLLWLGQIGTLEFHIWHSRARVGPDTPGASTDYAGSLAALEASVLNYPDYLVFDIDPYIYSGKEAKGEEPELNKKGFAVGKRVAFWLRAVLREMGLEAIIKTSGKTGLHMFVPVERTVTFDESRHICETVGRHVMRAHPKDITMEWAIEKRTGKIFIDYNMNVRGKTLNVAYSPRGVPGTPVSMPVTWEELEAAEPTDFTLSNVPARLEKRGDRWHDVLELKQSLTKAFGVKAEK
jgi:bifunctional non-homologous end joining protein LigD